MLSYDDLMKSVRIYNPEELDKVQRAYEFASKCHSGQFRKSGEPYIIHPVAVDCYLADFHADRDTLCAGLLHDVIEDCNVSKEEIAERFNEKTAELVDGVTNLTQVNLTRAERDYANIRKIILGATREARIPIIKVADRYHNMQTLEYKEFERRIAKSYETMKFYVPMARYFGIEQMRRELEDLSFKYLNEEAYRETKLIIDEYVAKRTYDFHVCIKKIEELLRRHGIKFSFKTRIKNVYTVYKRLNSGESIEDLHDLLALKIILKDSGSCYEALELIQSLYPEKENKYRDYIASPKVNGYQSLHDSFYGDNGLVFQVQIRTTQMERRDRYGIAGLWDTYKGKAADKMIEELRDFPFFKMIEKLGELSRTDEEFCNHLVSEILCDIISVHYDGRIIRIPTNLSIIDFAYRIGSFVGNHTEGARVNDREVTHNTILHDGDRIDLETSLNAPGPNPEWLDTVSTLQAELEIRKHLALGRGNNGIY